MIEGIKTLDGLEVKGKTILLRVDINSPVEAKTKKIKDDTRIRRSLPTIKELSQKGAKVVILAHQADPLDYQNFTSLKEHSWILENLLGKKIRFIYPRATIAMSKNGIESISHQGVIMEDELIEEYSYDRILSDFFKSD